MSVFQYNSPINTPKTSSPKTMSPPPTSTQTSACVSFFYRLARAAQILCGQTAGEIPAPTNTKTAPFLFAKDNEDDDDSISNSPLITPVHTPNTGERRSTGLAGGLASQVASSRRSLRADAVQWEELKKVVAKQGKLTQFERETVKSLERPPIRESYNSWRSFKKDVFRWALKLLRLGADPVELAQSVSGKSFKGSYITLEMLAESLGDDAQIAELMAHLDTFGSQQLRSLISTFERELPHVERWIGMLPNDYIMIMSVLFSREASLEVIRDPNSQVELTLNGLMLDGPNKKLARSRLAQEGSWNLGALATIFDDLDISDTTCYKMVRKSTGQEFFTPVSTVSTALEALLRVSIEDGKGKILEQIMKKYSNNTTTTISTTPSAKTNPDTTSPQLRSLFLNADNDNSAFLHSDKNVPRARPEGYGQPCPNGENCSEFLTSGKCPMRHRMKDINSMRVKRGERESSAGRVKEGEKKAVEKKQG